MFSGFVSNRLNLSTVKHSQFGEQYIKCPIFKGVSVYLQNKFTPSPPNTHTEPTSLPPLHRHSGGESREDEDRDTNNNKWQAQTQFSESPISTTSKGHLFYSRGHNKQFQVTYNSIKAMEDNQDVKTIQATLQSHPSLWLPDGLELLATSSNQSALSWCLLPLCCSWPISSQQILKGLPAHTAASTLSDS